MTLPHFIFQHLKLAPASGMLLAWSLEAELEVSSCRNRASQEALQASTHWSVVAGSIAVRSCT